MRSEHISYLLTVLEQGSINKASERLHITQQSLNTALSKLEDELDAHLLVRSPTGVTLTKAGEKAVAYAQEILQTVDELRQSVAGSAALGKFDGGRLELSAGPLLTQGPLPETLKDVRQRYKNVQISLVERENLDMIKALLNNEPRLFLMSVLEDSDREFKLLDLARLFYRVLGTAQVCALVSAGHPLARQKTVSKRTLIKYPLAIFQASEKAPNPMLTCLKEVGKVRIAAQTNNLSLFRQVIDDGEAVGFSPRYPNKTLNQPRSGTVLLTIKDLPETQVVCVADKSYYHKQQKLHDDFLDDLARCISGE